MTKAAANRRLNLALAFAMLAMLAACTSKNSARGVVDDLGYQIEQLKQQLARQNEQHDTELAEASGHLEGALAALRRMTGELVRTIEEAATAVVR